MLGKRNLRSNATLLVSVCVCFSMVSGGPGDYKEVWEAGIIEKLRGLEKKGTRKF